MNLNDLSNLVEVGSGAQGVVYRAQWQGITVIYKQLKIVTTGNTREELMNEFQVWQYVSSYCVIFIYLIIPQACCTPIMCSAVWHRE